MAWGSRATLAGLACVAVAGCGSVSSNAADGSADQASGSAGATAGTTGSAGAGTTGNAGATAGTSGSAGVTGGAGATGAGGSGGQGADRCEQGSDCASSVCWEQLDGIKTCATPPAALTLSSCQNGPTPCCASDADCTAGKNGRCWPRTSLPGCGGAIPLGNACSYDACATDADCKAGMPAGATAAVCVPAGAFGRTYAACAYGVCRTSADCTVHPGGVCQYGLAAPHGQCVFKDVLFCAYPSDPCPALACATPLECFPNDDDQGRQCSQGLPRYP
jgi:hypothetical protein